MKDVNLTEDERLIRTHLYTVEVWAEGRARGLYEQMKVTCNSNIETIGTMVNARLVIAIK